MKKKITDIWKFLTYDIWRITEDEVTRTKFSLYNIIKTIYLCINRFTKDRMANKASALTYSTLLAIVPILAILFAVARGFGFDNLMEQRSSVQNVMSPVVLTTSCVDVPDVRAIRENPDSIFLWRMT